MRKKGPTPEDYAQMRYRMQHRDWKAELSREARAWGRMAKHLYREQRAIALERRVTAFYGIRTSWPLIAAASIYYNVEGSCRA